MTHGIHEEKKFASPLPHAPPQTLPGPDKALRKTNKLPQEPHPQGKVPPGRKKETEIADVDSPKTADTATLPSRLIPPPPTCPSGQWGGGLKPPPRRLDPNIYFLININAHKSHPCRAHNRRDRARLLSLSHTCVPPPFCRLLSAAYKTSHSPPYPYATLHSTTTNNQFPACSHASPSAPSVLLTCPLIPK